MPDDYLEMHIVLRDGCPEVVLNYMGVKIQAPMRHTYSTQVSYDIFEAVTPWIPASVLEKHAPR